MSEERPNDSSRSRENTNSGDRRNNSGDNSERRPSNTQRKYRSNRKSYYRKKECKLCKNKIHVVDYKDIGLIRKFVTEKGKIVPRRMTGNCAKCQRKVKRAINKARNIGFLAFTNK